MTPTSFTFHLSVPRDAQLTAVVRDLAAHAVAYTKMDPATGKAFVERVAAATANAMAGPGSCAVDFLCGDGELRVVIGGDTVRQPLTA